MHRHIRRTRAAATHIIRDYRYLFVCGMALVLLIAASGYSPQGASFSSAEVKFADASKSGLSIVPASCPSNPHNLDECEVVGTCTITPRNTSIEIGQSTFLDWIVVQDTNPFFSGFQQTFDGNISPAVGAVTGWSGSVSVSPRITTGYVLAGTTRVSNPFFSWVKTGSVGCSTTVNVGSGPVCADGSLPVNGHCPTTCPVGYALQGNVCVPPSCSGGQDSAGGSQCPSCPAGYTRVNGACTAVSCPSGYTLVSGRCEITSCPPGYTLVNGACVSNLCSDGSPVPPSGVCPNSCTAQDYCVGTDHWRLTAQCTRSLVEACSYGCTRGGCIGIATPGVVLWQVRPPLVRVDDTVNVSWQVTGVRSCEVHGNNGDSWSGASGAQISTPITARTTYTLTCIGLDDSTVTRTATVNITPIPEEK